MSALLPLLVAARWPDLSELPGQATADRAQDVALIIAVEDYAAVPDVVGADEMGRLWQQQLHEALGVPLVKVLLDEQATREGILDAARGVAAHATPGARVWAVFVGHGSPSATSDDGLLVGWDAQQTARSIEARGVGRRELLAALAGPQSETVLILDACFSGAMEGGEDLAPGLSSVRPVSERINGSATVLSAASGREYAGRLPGQRVPAFSYLLLGAMRGWADSDGDGAVTVTEALDYSEAVLFTELTDRRQTPTLEGAGPVVLARPTDPEVGPVSYAGKREAAPLPAPRAATAPPAMVEPPDRPHGVRNAALVVGASSVALFGASVGLGAHYQAAPPSAGHLEEVYWANQVSFFGGIGLATGAVGLGIGAAVGGQW